MSTAVEIKTKPTTDPTGITSTGTTGTSPDGGGDAPPDPDPGPVKG
jgi:hypothetical protein